MSSERNDLKEKEQATINKLHSALHTNVNDIDEIVHRITTKVSAAKDDSLKKTTSDYLEGIQKFDKFAQEAMGAAIADSRSIAEVGGMIRKGYRTIADGKSPEQAWDVLYGELSEEAKKSPSTQYSPRMHKSPPLTLQSVLDSHKQITSPKQFKHY